MPEFPGEILDVWARLNASRPKRTAQFSNPFPPDAPSGRPRAADADIPAANIWNLTRGAGINVERAAGWGDVNWLDLVSAGNSWVRLFYPWRPDMDMNGPGSAAVPTDDQLARLVAGAEDAIEFGLDVVFLDATDVLDVSTARGWADQIDDVVRRMARLVKASRVLTVDNCCFGPVNEFAGGSEAEWKPYRDRWLASARAELPDHALSTGGFYWKSLFDLLEMGDPAPPGDPNVLVDAHQYEQGDWSEVADALRAWMYQHNRLVVVGEIGPYNPNWENIPRDGWEARYRAQSPLWSVTPLAPWASTYGTGLALNTPGRIDLDPMFQSLWTDTANVQALRPAAGGGEPPEPIIPGEFSATLVSRTDLELVVQVEAPDGKKPKVVVVENGTYAFRGQPAPVQPGTVRVHLVHHTDFAKFMLTGYDAIDVPPAQEAADYEPEDGGIIEPPEPPNPGGGGDYTEADLQRAFSDGWKAREDKALETFGAHMDSIEPPPYGGTRHGR